MKHTTYNNRAPDVDGVPADVLNEGSHELHSCLYALICRIWDDEQLSDELKNALSVTIFEKCDESNCNNYRGTACFPPQATSLPGLSLTASH